MINHPCKFLCLAYFLAICCTVLAAVFDLFNLADFKFRDWLIRDDPIINAYDRWDGLIEYIEDKMGIEETDEEEEEEEIVYEL